VVALGRIVQRTPMSTDEARTFLGIRANRG
jgi:hypothetical protein